MNLHQFRFVQEAVRRNLNLTETAKVLFTSQPGISKAILELEEPWAQRDLKVCVKKREQLSGFAAALVESLTGSVPE